MVKTLKQGSVGTTKLESWAVFQPLQMEERAQTEHAASSSFSAERSLGKNLTCWRIYCVRKVSNSLDQGILYLQPNAGH